MVDAKGPVHLRGIPINVSAWKMSIDNLSDC
jgi:hypothetical protein